MISKPKVMINEVELEKIHWYVDKCDVEISGLGKIVKLDDGTLYVNKIYLLKQECTASDTELDAEAIADLLYESRKDEGEMLFWWHSHHNMQVFWSGTDYATIEDLGKNGMIVASVFNKKREIRTAIYKKGDGIAPDMFIDELDLLVESPLTGDVIEELEAEYTNKVSFPTIWTGADRLTMLGAGYELDGDGFVQSSINNSSNFSQHYVELKKEWNKLSKKGQEMFIEQYAEWYGIPVDTTTDFGMMELLDFAEMYQFNLLNLEMDRDL